MVRILSIFFIAGFVFFSLQRQALAQELGATESAMPATVAASIQYELPYPGILPDHPLYFLKVFRDRFVGFLINDPVKKSEFNLLQSDKKLYSALMLMDKKEQDLAVDTLSKSNNYMHMAILDAQRAQKAHKSVSDVVSQLQTSIDKHKELITDMTKQSKSFAQELKRIKELETFYTHSFN